VVGGDLGVRSKGEKKAHAAIEGKRKCTVEKKKRGDFGEGRARITSRY